MKLTPSILLLLFVLAASALAGGPGPHSPIVHAREHTIEARAIIAKIDAGGRQKAIEALAGKLTAIESDLEGVKNNKGTALPNAKKLIDEAKAAAEAAGRDPEKLKEVDARLEELLKQIHKAIAAISR